MTIAILDPFSGIAGDMMLGALIDVGVEPEWLRGLPQVLGLDGVTVSISDVRKAGIAAKKVDFAIPPQPHGRHLRDIRRLVDESHAPKAVRARADAVFLAIAQAEGGIHGVAPERVHLHEVGSVDAILDVVGSIWGLDILGVERVYCGPITMGDGTVEAAHGTLPVPAPATLKLLEGFDVRGGPAGAGELVTPTGAALVRVLSAGAPPDQYRPVRSGFGAGTKDLPGRANVLRIVLAERSTASTTAESLTMLSADVDDMTGEGLARLAQALRQSGALDVVLLSTLMKKGRPGTRIEALTRPGDVAAIENVLFSESTTLGVRHFTVERRALPRSVETVEVRGRPVRVKVATLPDGSSRAKPEFGDVDQLANELGVSVDEISREALEALRRKSLS